MSAIDTPLGQDADAAGVTFFYAFAGFVLAAPLFKAGDRPLPLLLLELGAVALLLAMLATPRTRLPLPRSLTAGVTLLLAYPLAQLVPLPAAWWPLLPGHAEYASTLARFAPPADDGAWRSLSLVSPATEYGLLALLAPLACLLATLRLRTEDVARLLFAMCALAGAQALLGLLQVGAGGNTIFYLRNDVAYGTAVGTFVNRNHFAAMLAMTLPVIVGLLAYGIRRQRRHRRRGLGVDFNANVLSQRSLLFALAVLVLVCLAFTRSRAGIATALVGLALSSVLLLRARGSARHANLLVPALITLGVVLALAIGVAPILERVEPAQLRLDATTRWSIYAAALRAAFEFLPFGSGLSTFASVFPRFQTSALGGFVEYAHNDYLQAFVELGLVAPIAIGLLLAAYGARMRALLQRERGRSFTVLQIAAGIALIPMLLHSLFDFGLHMPANAIWFATLAGVLFHRGALGMQVAKRRPTGDGARVDDEAAGDPIGERLAGEASDRSVAQQAR